MTFAKRTWQTQFNGQFAKDRFTANGRLHSLDGRTKFRDCTLDLKRTASQNAPREMDKVKPAATAAETAHKREAKATETTRVENELAEERQKRAQLEAELESASESARKAKRPDTARLEKQLAEERQKRAQLEAELKRAQEARRIDMSGLEKELTDERQRRARVEAELKSASERGEVKKKETAASVAMESRASVQQSPKNKPATTVASLAPPSQRNDPIVVTNGADGFLAKLSRSSDTLYGYSADNTEPSVLVSFSNGFLEFNLVGGKSPLASGQMSKFATPNASCVGIEVEDRFALFASPGKSPSNGKPLAHYLVCVTVREFTTRSDGDDRRITDFHSKPNEVYIVRQSDLLDTPSFYRAARAMKP